MVAIWWKDGEGIPADKINFLDLLTDNIICLLGSGELVDSWREKAEDSEAQLSFLSSFSDAMQEHNTGIEGVPESLLELILHHRSTTAGFICLLPPDNQPPVEYFSDRELRVHIGKWREWLLQLPQAVYFNDSFMIEKILGQQTGIRSLIASSFSSPDGTRGGICLWNRKEEPPFTNRDISFFNLIVDRLKMQIEHIQLTRRNIEKERYEQDLLIAQQVQINLLPKSSPQVRGIEYSAISLMARTVGGDFYDFYRSAADKLIVAVGDISGKSVPAALLQILVQRELRERLQARESSRQTQPLNQLVREMNEKLFDTFVELNMFTTLFLLEINSRTGHVTFANGGHPHPLHSCATTGTINPFTCFGMPLGLMEKVDYEHGEMQMAPGDAMLIFTDGLTEVFNSNDEPYPEERLYRKFADVSAAHPKEIIKTLCMDADQWGGQQAPRDDRTVFCLRFDGVQN